MFLAHRLLNLFDLQLYEPKCTTICSSRLPLYPKLQTVIDSNPQLLPSSCDFPLVCYCKCYESCPILYGFLLYIVDSYFLDSQYFTMMRVINPPVLQKRMQQVSSSLRRVEFQDNFSAVDEAG